jgi:alkylation response protein AidB-like acyl-CoA dehydrogenase
VKRVCERFPNEYWLKLDHEDAYPSEFVAALTEAGYLGALIPEEYDGTGLPLSRRLRNPGDDPRVGCNAAACHAQMYTMGTVLRHGNDAQKKKYLPGIAAGTLRLQAFGVTEPTTGSDTTQLKTRADKKGNDRYVVNGQKVWTSRVLHSDLMLLLARTTPPDKVRKRSGRAVGVPGRPARGEGKGVEISKIDAMINHNTCEVFFDNLEVPAENLIGEEARASSTSSTA